MNKEFENDPSMTGLQSDPVTSPSDMGEGMPAAAAELAGEDTTFGGTTTSASDTNQSARPLRDELAQFKSELDVLVAHAATLSERELGEAYHVLMEKFQSFRAVAKDFASNAQQQLNHGMEVTRERVKEKPVQSVAIAAGAGALIALAMSGRRKKDQYR